MVYFPHRVFECFYFTLEILSSRDLSGTEIALSIFSVLDGMSLFSNEWTSCGVSKVIQRFIVLLSSTVKNNNNSVTLPTTDKGKKC